jgi:hypothetical protein
LTGAVIGTGAGAGRDSLWEQEKLEARKMLDAKRAAESYTSTIQGNHNWLTDFCLKHGFFGMNFVR